MAEEIITEKIEGMLSKLTSFSINPTSFAIWSAAAGGLLFIFKPATMFANNGKPKKIGLNYDSETILPWWLGALGAGYIMQRIV